MEKAAVLDAARELGLSVGLSEVAIQDALAAGVKDPFEPTRPEARANVLNFPSGADPQLGTAHELQKKTFDPIRYVVPGYIPDGCTILAGRPKAGKSWLMLDVAIAVAAGRICLGDIGCEEGDVLYLALEDNERRLQTRIKKILGTTKEWPSRFTYATDWPRADAGGLERIRTWIAQAKNPKLIVIDVFAMFRGAPKGRDNPYTWDYDSLKGLQKIASETNVAIVVVHHLRKGAGGDDPIDKVSGTLGLTGAADTILILDRSGGGTSLCGRGRDIEEFDVAIHFDKETCRWRMGYDDERVRGTTQRNQILEILVGAREPMTPAEIVIGTGMKRNNVDQLLFQMVRANEVHKVGRAQYIHPQRQDLVQENKNDKKIRKSKTAGPGGQHRDAVNLSSYRSYPNGQGESEVCPAPPTSATSERR